MIIKLLGFFNILLAALLAGSSFGIWVGFNPTHFSAASYLEQQQHLVRSLNVLMVSMVILATLVTAVSAFLQRSNKTVFWLLLLAAACFASCILISRLGNFPIQNEMLAWDAASLPDNWAALRDRWWSFHRMRTVAELIGLALVAWATVKQK